MRRVSLRVGLLAVAVVAAIAAGGWWGLVGSVSNTPVVVDEESCH